MNGYVLFAWAFMLWASYHAPEEWIKEWKKQKHEDWPGQTRTVRITLLMCWAMFVAGWALVLMATFA